MGSPKARWVLAPAPHSPPAGLRVQVTNTGGVKLLAGLVGLLISDALVWLPGVTALGGYAAALTLAGSLSVAEVGQLESFFGTSAQVLVGLVIALAFSTAVTDRRGPLARPLFPVVVYVVVALIAAVGGLVPGATVALKRQAFAVSAAGGLASAIALCVVLFEAFRRTARDSDEEWRDRLVQLGVLTTEGAINHAPVHDALGSCDPVVIVAIHGSIWERRRARRKLAERALSPGHHPGRDQ
jgi:hypothetical protein